MRVEFGPVRHHHADRERDADDGGVPGVVEVDEGQVGQDDAHEDAEVRELHPSQDRVGYGQEERADLAEDSEQHVDEADRLKHSQASYLEDEDVKPN